MGLAILFSESVFGILIGYLVITSVFNIIWYFKSKKLINNNKQENETVSYGLFVTKIQILSLIVVHFDKIIVGFFDIEILAVYAISLKMLDMIKSLSKSVFSVTFPKFAKGNIRITAKHILLLLFAGLFLSTIFYFSIDYIIIKLFTDKFSGSINLFKKLIWIATLYPAFFLLVQKISAQKNKKKMLQLRIFPPLTAILLSVGIFLITNKLEFLILTRVYTSFIGSFLILIFRGKQKGE